MSLCVGNLKKAAAELKMRINLSVFRDVQYTGTLLVCVDQTLVYKLLLIIQHGCLMSTLLVHFDTCGSVLSWEPNCCSM